MARTIETTLEQRNKIKFHQGKSERDTLRIISKPWSTINFTIRLFEETSMVISRARLGWLSKVKKTADYLRPKTLHRSPFYGLPKIHKFNIPLRPIVLGCDGPTDKLSQFVTHFI